MNALNLPDWMRHLTNRSVAAPLIIILLLAMMILPLPAIVLDMLFSFNIALAILVLLIGLQTKKALDFIAFPEIYATFGGRVVGFSHRGSARSLFGVCRH